MLRHLAAAVAHKAGRYAAAQQPVGPECSDPVRSAVLDALSGRTDVYPGQRVQYLQIVQVGERYVVQACVVTIPDDWPT